MFTLLTGGTSALTAESGWDQILLSIDIDNPDFASNSLSIIQVTRWVKLRLIPRLSGWTRESNSALKSILRGTLFLNRLQYFSLLSTNSFLHPFLKSKFSKKNFLALNFFHFRRPIFRNLKIWKENVTIFSIRCLSLSNSEYLRLVWVTVATKRKSLYMNNVWSRNLLWAIPATVTPATVIRFSSLNNLRSSSNHPWSNTTLHSLLQ